MLSLQPVITELLLEQALISCELFPVNHVSQALSFSFLQPVSQPWPKWAINAISPQMNQLLQASSSEVFHLDI